MEKRQKRILNQNGVQALSPTHGMNIVVGYFTRQQPHDYEFAMHTSTGSGDPSCVVRLSKESDLSPHKRRDPTCLPWLQFQSRGQTRKTRAGTRRRKPDV